MKKAISLLLLVSLLTMSACSGGEAPLDTETTTAADTTTETTVNTTAPEYEKPDVDYKGETVTFAAYTFEFGYQIDKYTVALNEENADIINDAIVDRNRTVEEELGVDIEQFVLDKNDRNTTSKIQTLILAGDDQIDAALTMTASLSTIMATENMALNLRSIPTMDLNHSWWDQNANEEYLLFGKQLAAVGDICTYNLGAPIVVYFSQKLLKQHALDDPYQLVRDGKWTLDKMMEMSQTASVDLNGDGAYNDTDQFGFAGEVVTHRALLFAGGLRYSERDADGTPKLCINNESTVAATSKIVTFLNDLAHTRVHGKTEQRYTSFFTDYVVPKMMEDGLLFFSNQLLLALDLRAMEGDFGVLPLPKYDEAQSDYHTFVSPYWGDTLIVPTTSSDVNMAGHVIDAMGYYSQQSVTPAFVDTSVVMKSIRDDNSAEMIYLIYDSLVYDIASVFDWGNLNTMFDQMLQQNNTNFASSYSAIETSIKTAMDESLKLMGKK